MSQGLFGNSGSGSSTSLLQSPAYGPAIRWAGQLRKDVGPILGDISSQLQSLFQTGISPGSTIPMINRSTDSARAALAGSEAASRNTIAGMPGAANNPMIMSRLAGQNMAGNQAVSSIGPTMANQFWNTYAPMMSGHASDVTNAYSSAGAMNQAQFGYENFQQTPSIMNDVGQVTDWLSQIMSMITGGALGSKTATASNGGTA